MTSKLTAASYFALTFLLLSLAAHITGLVTNFWCIGATDDSSTDVTRVHFGLFKQVVEYRNGTVVESETWLRLKEEQYVVMAVAGVNTLLCLILYIKVVHIFVGVSSFIMMTLMLLCAIYTFERTESTVERMQGYHSDWPKLALAWSFACVFAGLVVNIISSAIFLSVLLIKGEHKESRSSKGLGPPVESGDDKDPAVSTVAGNSSYENAAYNNDNIQKDRTARASTSEAVAEGQGHPAEFMLSVRDISVEDNDKRVYEKLHNNKQDNDTYVKIHYENNKTTEPVTDLDAVEFEEYEEGVSTVTESIHL